MNVVFKVYWNNPIEMVAEAGTQQLTFEVPLGAIISNPSSGGGTASYPSFIGNADKVLTVNATEDDVEWTAAVTQVYVDQEIVDLNATLSTSISSKADVNYVDTQDSLLQDQINLKAGATDVSQSLALKADLADVNQSLDLKANLTDVNQSLDLKANTIDVNQSLDLKANKTYVDTQDELLQDQINLKADGTYVNQSLALKADGTYVNQSLALKADLIGGLIPASQLPSYVDDVLEYENVAAFPATGETGKIYVETTGNTTYRWSGTGYIKITSGEVSSVAGKAGVVTLTKSDVGLPNVDDTADSSKSVASATKLTTARLINGIAFDGTGDINLDVYSKAETDSIAGTPDATETVAGKAKIATTAVSQEGTNDTDIITSLKLKNTVFGLGQNRKEVTKISGTTYTNTTGKPVGFEVIFKNTGSIFGNMSSNITVNSVIRQNSVIPAGDADQRCSMFVIILPNESYSFNAVRVSSIEKVTEIS